ncbi:MAG: type II toxin-antitoxin system Phd/YefM family antitoxin [Candidatus Hydrogenedentes bacterium]|nr:type II toxin-antitoxin system Phd/YefM family antitoxin [Candidatus Hydrogenedentota bacterium]
MKTMAIREFKARAQQVLDQVVKTREPLVVTKWGRPIAKVIP